MSTSEFNVRMFIRYVYFLKFGIKRKQDINIQQKLLFIFDKQHKATAKPIVFQTSARNDLIKTLKDVTYKI